MPRRGSYIKKDDVAPRVIDKNKKPNIKLYADYEEAIEKDGEVGWVITGWFYDQKYSIPVRTSYSFGAIHASYRLLLKAQIDKVDPNTGQVFPGDNRAAQFADGRFETKDLFDVRGIYRSDAFSSGRIWDQNTENAKQREGAYKSMKSMLMNDPDFKKRFLAEMQAELAGDAKASAKEPASAAPKE